MSGERYKYDDIDYHYDSTPEDASDEDRFEMAGLHIGLMAKWCAGKGFLIDAAEPCDPQFDEDVRLMASGGMNSTAFIEKWGDEKLVSDMISAEGRPFLDRYYGDDGLYLDDYQQWIGDGAFEKIEKDADFAAFSAMVDRRYAEFRADGAQAVTRKPEPGFFDKFKAAFGRKPAS